MGIGKGIKQLRKEAGFSLRSLAELVGMPHDTIHKIENDKLKQGPRLKTIIQIGTKGGFDMHRLAHYAFNLHQPEETGERQEDLKAILDALSKLSPTQRARIIGRIEGWLERDAEGGGAQDKTQDTQAGYG